MTAIALGCCARRECRGRFVWNTSAESDAGAGGKARGARGDAAVRDWA